MNIMKEAHAMARRMIANNVEGKYPELLACALRHKHAVYKQQCEALATGSRNLYKVIDKESGHVAAFITAPTQVLAYDVYRANGGRARSLDIRQESFGYPQELKTIYK
jgi:hypothetical protein